MAVAAEAAFALIPSDVLSAERGQSMLKWCFQEQRAVCALGFSQQGCQRGCRKCQVGNQCWRQLHVPTSPFQGWAESERVPQVLLKFDVEWAENEQTPSTTNRGTAIWQEWLMCLWVDGVGRVCLGKRIRQWLRSAAANEPKLQQVLTPLHEWHRQILLHSPLWRFLERPQYPVCSPGSPQLLFQRKCMKTSCQTSRAVSIGMRGSLLGEVWMSFQNESSIEWVTFMNKYDFRSFHCETIGL